MTDRDHTGIDFDDLIDSAVKTALTALAVAIVLAIALAAILAPLWVMASPDRPTACAAYSGAEVAACIAEAR